MKTAAHDVNSVAQSFRAHMEAVRECYLRRDIQGYLAGFADYYCGLQFNGSPPEDKVGLQSRIESEFQRFDLLSMEFTVDHMDFTDERGYASLKYLTKLRSRKDARVLTDERSNLVIGRRQADGSWLLEAKITLCASIHYAEPTEEGADSALPAQRR